MSEKRKGRQGPSLKEAYDKNLKNLLFAIDSILQCNGDGFETLKDTLKQYRDTFVETQQKITTM